jgi:ATP-dependent helicase/nuclease subunit B
MDWLESISNSSIVLVPTRGLQYSLSQHYIEHQLKQGRQTWETPRIWVWEDYINALWQHNKASLKVNKIRLDQNQAFLVWQQIILKNKGKNQQLLLLNEQQTANVALRSWRLMHQWQIGLEDIQQNQDIDSAAFKEWCQDYTDKLQKHGWIDTWQLESFLFDGKSRLDLISNELVFASFDLLSTLQRRHIQECQNRGITIQQLSVEYKADVPNDIEYRNYQTPQQEVLSVFAQAREHLEANPELKIGIVIPQLAEQYASIEQLARQVFYPDKSPLQCQQEERVYRFSLGQPLIKSAYIHTMLTALALLKKSFAFADLSYLLQSHWLPALDKQESDNESQLMQMLHFNQALKKKCCAWLSWQDVLTISLEALPEATDLHEKLAQVLQFQKGILNLDDNNQGKQPYHSASQWQQIFSEWLSLFNWQNNELDSWHYQIHESWMQVLDVFRGCDLVQGEISLHKALVMLQGLCKDQVFMRQAKAEPILISGVLDGVGHPVDFLYITGMHEAYPSPAPQEPFIPNRALAQKGYPFASKSEELQYEKNKLQSLFAGGKQVFVSYAKQYSDGEYGPSTLLRNLSSEERFKSIESISRAQSHAHSFSQSFSQPLSAPLSDTTSNFQADLEPFEDIQGEVCLDSQNIQGGAKVFQNQSHCPFKAYVEHRILPQSEEEPEFGLDARDAGIVVHRLLENIWTQLKSYSALTVLDEVELKELINLQIDQYLENPGKQFQFDRKTLLMLERQRLQNLLFEWLCLEREQRIQGFQVIANEANIHSEFGGIPVNVVIDRIDQMDNGDYLVIDYKTGQSGVSDWQGERPYNPQLPLYALALNQHKKQSFNIQGIAYGKLKNNDCQLLGLTGIEEVGAGVQPPKIERKPVTWQEQLVIWHDNLSRLAAEFLDGHAIVDPARETICDYCELTAVCRVQQLRAQTSLETQE